MSEVTSLDTKIDFYDSVFENYVVGDRSRSLIFARKYSGKDPTALDEMNLLNKFYLAAVHCVTVGRIDELKNVRTVAEFVQRNYTEELLLNYTQNYSSPGQTGLYGRNPIHTLAVSGLFALASSFSLSSCMSQDVAVAESESSDEKEDAAHIQSVILQTINPDLARDSDEKFNIANEKLALETPIEAVNE